MKHKLEEIRASALETIHAAADLAALEQLRVKYLGRKGELTEILRGLAQCPPEDRPLAGKAANEVKLAVADALEARKEAISKSLEAASATAERLDLSLPGRRPLRGHKHPVMRVAEEICDIFIQLGFQIASGPDVETEYYNFDSLNTPADHPARDLHDTFFVKPGVVLRTHTSPVQMRVMEQTQPPVAVIVPGRVYRVDQDASHSPMFYQIEGLLVDKGISFADLKGVLQLFIQRYFGPTTRTRFRPHYFPFTEPSAEVDISCTVCSGQGCRVCKQSGWLEILGCGMVDPEVFKYARYDSETYTGFAFGMGVERIAMLTHAINSIHYLYENDLRFLEQF
ncbi:MAG TPA: phenylalanine--tRNA ligase subunit alpha [Candidatus Hydrogenedentes bacterium]|jgi:phenylalanyl-tRNA synthetase alpha chain|nr:phenylalanine--tRNA ligase subunit alpha [Candidatus Hydrogenedentota bacterium]HPJ98813.1 phenylalanine--tRNA ligase subunit alpha [Candidatus Hydrogenedentota bacterium]